MAGRSLAQQIRQLGDVRCNAPRLPDKRESESSRHGKRQISEAVENQGIDLCHCSLQVY
jgi:hypothetical protein